MSTLALQVTSRDARVLSDYLIRDWKIAGLEKESIADTARLLELNDSDYGMQIGHLTDYDILEIQFMLSRSHLLSVY